MGISPSEVNRPNCSLTETTRKNQEISPEDSVCCGGKLTQVFTSGYVDFDAHVVKYPNF